MEKTIHSDNTAPAGQAAATAAILVIGDEILSGKTEEKNARFLITELRGLGVALRRILTIPDEVETVAAATRELSAQFDYVFTSGGVGPTHDDVTIRGIARAFDRVVTRHPELESRLRASFGEKTEEAHLRMADVPAGAELIETRDMRWPVLKCENVWILPGVPELFQKKFTAIREQFRVTPFFTRAVYTHEDEFAFAARLQDIATRHPLVSIGSYPNFATPDFRVKLTFESKDEVALAAAVSAVDAMLDPARLIRWE
ncbi:MAG: competence/damage-inducible protein A [Blastocatellia bacterium]